MFHVFAPLTCAFKVVMKHYMYKDYMYNLQNLDLPALANGH